MLIGQSQMIMSCLCEVGGKESERRKQCSVRPCLSWSKSAAVLSNESSFGLLSLCLISLFPSSSLCLSPSHSINKSDWVTPWRTQLTYILQPQYDLLMFQKKKKSSSKQKIAFKMCCLLKLTAGQISSESNDKVSMTFSWHFCGKKQKLETVLI